MKCPFCVADNPDHANFCMNCGSPLDLKACSDCGGINRKTASHCQMCGVPFAASVSAATVSPPPAPPPSHTQEAAALARETQTFKQLFAELEKDVNHQLMPVRASTASASPAAPPSDGPAALPPAEVAIPVVPPAYMQEMLSARAAKKGSGRNQRLVIVAIFLVILVSYGYCTTATRHKPPTSSQAQHDSPEEKPATPEQSVPALSLASVAPVLSGVPCSALAASILDHALQVQGYIPQRFGITRLKDALRTIPGVKTLSVDVWQVSDDQCDVIKLFAPYWTRNRQAGGTASIHTRQPNAELTQGDPLIVDITTPGYESYFNVDYYVLDGSVVHLAPSPRAKDNQAPPNYSAIVGRLGDWVISEPFGAELIVLLVTPVPLFDGMRPERESRSDYLPAADKRLGQIASKYGPERITADIVQITTKARSR